jgi:hypothetical protein
VTRWQVDRRVFEQELRRKYLVTISSANHVTWLVANSINVLLLEILHIFLYIDLLANCVTTFEMKTMSGFRSDVA